MALRHALSAVRLRRALVVLFVVLVVIPLCWLLVFGIGHGSGHAGLGPIFSGH
jgi:hypothetical protein